MQNKNKTTEFFTSGLLNGTDTRGKEYFQGIEKKKRPLTISPIISTHLIWEWPQLVLDFSKLLVCILTPVGHLPQTPVSFVFVRFPMLRRNSECEEFLDNKLTFIYISNILNLLHINVSSKNLMVLLWTLQNHQNSKLSHVVQKYTRDFVTSLEWEFS